MFATYVSANGRHSLSNNDYLSSMEYSHDYVNHSINFVDPVTGAHTNTIEGLWEIHIKRHIKRMRGVRKNIVDGYLDEFMWRSWFFRAQAPPQEYMCGLIQAIRKQYAF